MIAFSTTDKIVILRVVTLALAAISIRTTLIHAGLILRLGKALIQRRTHWPGPRTRFTGRLEAQNSMILRTPPPRLYPRYIVNAGMLVLTSGAFIRMAYDFVFPSGFLAVKEPFVILPFLIIVVLAYFVAARRVARYDAELEWALSHAPWTPIDTAEVEIEVAQTFVAVRKAIRRIWTQIWLMALSGIFIWFAFINHEGAQVESAFAHPSPEPISRKHVEQVVSGKSAFYFPVPGGFLRQLQETRIIPANLAMFTTDDGQEALAILLRYTLAENKSNRVMQSAIVYYPYCIFAYPELGAKYPRALVVMGTKEDMASFAKGRQGIPIICSIIYIGFCIRGIFLITSLRRWLHVALAKKGRIKL